LAGELAHGFGAAIERAHQPPCRPHGEEAAQSEHDADQSEQLPQTVHRSHEPAVFRPAEPADDATAHVVQGLQRPAVLADRIGVEGEIAEAAAACDCAQLNVIGRVDVAELRVKFVKRLLQGGALLRFHTAFADSAGRDAGRRAQHHGSGHAQRQEQQGHARGSDPRIVGKSGNRRRRASPVCCPQSPGRRGHHTQRP
jgi:hypothetical protein